ncbi:MAG: DNA mismatch repair protein MutS [Deltaproteobacteria bacterium]|nr:DNA mismatch repair protein MutS [Deltaproteobacteria bacterium]
MRQFLEIKERYPDAIVFFRLGDFYEMFFDDAVVAAGLLDLTLTTRDKGKDDAVPMCGVPHHASRGYIARLTEHGRTVVVCEQTEDPKLAKGLVKREVVRVVTPGITLDDEVLDPRQARYLACVVPGGAKPDAPWGLAYLDVTTGEFRAATITGAAALADELARVAPREVLATAADLEGAAAPVRARWRVPWTAIELPAAKDARAALDAELATGKLLADHPHAAVAAAAVLAYARATQPAGVLPVVRLALYDPAATVVLDETAIANLELVQTLIGARTQGSLLAVLDDTRTAPGARLMRRWLLYPLTDVPQIRRRHDAVEWLTRRPHLRAELRRALADTGDLERLAGKATLGVATPRDLGRLRDSLLGLPDLVALVQRGAEAIDPVPELVELAPIAAPALAALGARLTAALVEQPPAMTKDGGVIRGGHDAIVDESRALTDGGKEAVLAIEVRERERSGIGSLRVRYNRVFGYYLEITKSHLARVPADYIRKQTVATGERYVTPELAELESKILTAQETLIARETELFRGLVGEVAALAAALGQAGAALAVLDVVTGLAEVAQRQGYVRPTVDDGLLIDLEDSRHPVIEAANPAGSFVPNDCRLDPAREQLVLITGPNMAGKSTYMRQVAHAALMAQLGSFVAAKRAHIGVCDRVFTRVGAADDLSRGESTFMVEMRESAAILAGATRRSLVVLDEVGRGTSTFDGVSIAWAVAEYLHDAIGARTLFATHYHELCALAETRPRVKNVSVAVREHQGEVVFLRRVIAGAASRSYGIDVARLAGLPRTVIARARQILAQLEGGAHLGASPQLSLMPLIAPAPTDPGTAVLARLRAIDPDHLTPMEALATLAALRAESL